jgi:cell pole-organizing protein PopZ
MQSPGREPSMEDILASIKKVIAEEKELRVAAPADRAVDDETLPEDSSESDDVLELDQPLTPPTDLRPSAMDLGPPLIDEQVAGKSRQSLEQLQTVAATVPLPQSGNPLEEMVREMLRPMLKAWLDENLPPLIDEHVKREISRITGRPL